MAEINSESVVSAVLKTLQKKFTSTKRYRDSQNQHIVKPCFFVEQIGASPEKQMNTRARRNPRIKITYTPEGNEESLTKHLRSVADRLIEALQLLPLNATDSVFGRNTEYEIVNGELIFTTEYPMHVIYQVTPQPLQTNLEPNIGIK